MPFPSDGAVSKLVATFAKNGMRGLPYMSSALASTRNASVYIDHVRAWKERYHIEGCYSDGLAEDDWLVRGASSQYVISVLMTVSPNLFFSFCWLNEWRRRHTKKFGCFASCFPAEH